MKNFLLFTLIILSGFAFGQAQYKVELNNLRFEIKNAVKNSTSSNVTLTLIYEDNSTEEVYYRNITEQEHDEWNWNLNPSLITTKKPKAIRTSGFIHFRTGTDAHYDITSNLKFCNKQDFIVGSNSPRMSDITFNVRISPIHNLKNELINGLPNTYLPYDSKVKLLDVEGFSPELYNYQYNVSDENGNITESNWQDINSNLYDKHILTVSGKDLLGNTYKQYLGRKIYFRAVSCLENGVYLSKSNPVFLTLILSAPKITSASFVDITCYGDNNGQVTLNFDRLLEQGETLEGSLVNTDTGGVIGNYNLSSLANATTYTISGLAKGNYRLDLAQGTYGGNPTYTDGTEYSYTFTIKEPKPVEFSVTQSTDVFCYGGADGTISISATGEPGRTFKYSITNVNNTVDNWVDFSSAGSTKIDNLPAGKYIIKVMDSNGCYAKEGTTIKEINIEIKQPDAPLSLPENEITIEQPKGYGLSDGLISVRVIGGTSNTDGSYNFEWRKDSPTGELIDTSKITTDAVNNPFTIVLKDIPAGKYYLTVKDKNYALALNGITGCGIISKEFIVEQPLPLVAEIKIQEEILCNIDNEFIGNYDTDSNLIPDQAENGKLNVNVTGGISPYQYKWFKKENGVFTELSNETTLNLNKQTAGTYKVEVTDKNNNKTQAELVFNSPTKLTVAVEANELICNSDNGGIVTAIPNGGVADYTYRWNTSDTTSTVTDLSAGNYFVTIKDKNSCVATNSVTIKEPSSFDVEVVQQIHPTCFGATNGLIEISVAGGTAPYQIEWSNGAKGQLISGLSAGNYTVTITDTNGCKTVKTYTLTQPVETKVDLGKDITLCLGDSMEYDVTIADKNAKYQWFDEKGQLISTSPKISIALPGEYTVKVFNEAGCSATDKVIIKSSSAILQPEFMIATHAFVDANVKLVNTSKIVPERVEWILPKTNDFNIIQQNNENIEIKFSKTGKYQFGLKGYQGECEKTFYKEVLVEENINGIDTNPKSVSNIKDFIVTPNPNNGQYKVIVKLYEAKPIRIRMVDMLSQQFYVSSEFNRNTEFEIPFNQTLASGTYFVILETENEMLMRRMLIK
ncbi:Por secretion system C-terminal sorting domain [Algoriella xinjiangensis]|uniref:T9SS type A sorting domain-containing protein n=1 Tax=Algoriella xinjiangensis TaxID=684065 RepID=UPI000F633B64|nr:T9SS type A sorting domain-containing protein [Algoriella xinjiangensis]VDH15444.1 Por secretion system C-terminal sorting domain [Algoriella xinjiangensis]